MMTWTPNAERSIEQRRRASTRGWRRTRQLVLDRDGHRCTATRNGIRCDRAASEVHHIVSVAQGGSDDTWNLAAICSEHHKLETQAEAAAARRRYTNRRPPERHPGLRG